MTSTNNTVTRVTPTWVKILLALSLAFNLLVIGAMVGAVSRFGGSGKAWHDDARKRPEGAMIAAFDRKDTRAMFRQIKEARRARAAELPDTRAELLAAIRAVPFDPERLEEVFVTRKSEAQARHNAFQSALISRISEFSDAERAAYADRIEAHMKKRKKR